MANTPTNKKTTQQPDSNPGRLQVFLWAGLAMLLSFIALSPVMDNSFINQDDNLYIFENKELDKPLTEAIPYFFQAHYYSGNYVPVTMTGYALAYRISGAAPETYHKVSLFLHLLNVLAVFWLAWLLSRRRVLVAAITALLFGIHPMHVESVAWAAELKDMLYTLFFVTGLAIYYQYTEERQDNRPAKFPIGAFTLFTFAVLCKPAAVIFPLVMLVTDMYAGRKMDKQAWVEKLPFFAISIVFGIVAIIAQRADHLINDHYTLVQRLLFACYGLVVYAGKFFAPVHLSTFYPYPSAAGGHIPAWLYAMPVVLAAIAVAVYMVARRSRVVAFGALFFVVNLLLVLQVITVGNAVIADRYTYVPYIGLAFIVAMGFDYLYTDNKLKPYKTPATVLMALVAVAFAYTSYGRSKVWESQDTIAADILDKFPDDHFALNNRGYLLGYQGRHEEAIALFKKAVTQQPDYIMAYANMANSYIAMKQPDAAMAAIDTALTYAPHDYNLLNKKGFLWYIKGDYAKAITYLDEALRLHPGDIDVYINLLQCYDAQHDHDKWTHTLDAALHDNPDNPLLLNNKGYDLMSRGQYADAVTYFKAALDKKPGDPNTQANLQRCYQLMNNPANTGTGK